MSQDQQPKKVSSQQPSQEQTPEQPKEQPKAPKGYTPVKNEEGLFHVEMQPAGDPFDPKTGKPKYKPYIQKFHPRDFALQISLNELGEPVYATVGNRFNKILHTPKPELLEGITVAVVENRREVKIPITEALARIEKIIASQQ